MTNVPFPGDVTTPAGQALLLLDRILTDPDHLPVSIGRFTRLISLGERGTVSTYRAIDDDGEPRLLRVFELDGIDLADKTSSLEIEVALTFDHPHLLPMREAGDVGDLHLAVLDDPDGPSYRERLVRRGPLRWTEAVSVGLAVARALEVYHGHHVMHRGVRPSDIYLRPNGVALGPPETPPLSNIAGESRRSGRGVVVYAAPEVIRNDDVGPAADLYALGLTLRELLTGTPVIAARDLSRAVRLALGPLPALTVDDDWPPGLASLVSRLCAHRPDDRPAGVAQVVADLLTLSTSTSRRAGAGRRGTGSDRSGTPGTAPSPRSTPDRTPDTGRATTDRTPGADPGPRSLAALASIGTAGPHTSGQSGEVRIYRRADRPTDPTPGGTPRIAPKPTSDPAPPSWFRQFVRNLTRLAKVALVVTVCAGGLRACAALGGPAGSLFDRLSADGFREGFAEDELPSGPG